MNTKFFPALLLASAALTACGVGTAVTKGGTQDSTHSVATDTNTTNNGGLPPAQLRDQNWQMVPSTLTLATGWPTRDGNLLRPPSGMRFAVIGYTAQSLNGLQCWDVAAREVTLVLGGTAYAAETINSQLSEGFGGQLCADAGTAAVVHFFFVVPSSTTLQQLAAATVTTATSSFIPGGKLGPVVFYDAPDGSWGYEQTHNGGNR